MSQTFTSFDTLQVNGKVETCFVGNYDVHSGSAQCIFDKVAEVLRARNVELSRVMATLQSKLLLFYMN